MSKTFALKERNARVTTEIIAGITTFFTMAYIIVTIPGMISGKAGSELESGVYIATCLAAFAGTMLMGLLANLPLAVAPSYGLCALFAYTVMEDYSYPQALAIVFISGILFILLTACRFDKVINRAIPKNLKLAVAAGIGLFVAYIGLKNSGIIVFNSEDSVTGLFRANGIMSGDKAAYVALMTLFGLIVMGFLTRLRIPGSILIGIAGTSALYWVISIATGMDKLPQASFSFSGMGDMFGSWLGNSFGVVFTKGFGGLFKGEDFVKGLISIGSIVLSFVFIDMFDSTGTILGAAMKNSKQSQNQEGDRPESDGYDLLDDKGNVKDLQKAFFADSIATTVGAVFGVSTTTTSVESCAGVTEGGKTGLTSVTTAICFVAALFCAPFIGYIPTAATSAALIYIGMLMMSTLKGFDWSDTTSVLPAFLCIIIMPFSGSIADGIYIGVIAHVLIKLVTLRLKDLSVTEMILAAIFVLKYLFLVL